MSKEQNIFVAIALVVALIVASFVIYQNQNDNELKVYVSYLDDPFIKIHLDKVVLVSSVSMCNIDLEDLNGDKELYESFKAANNDTSNPRSLSKLTTHANVIEHSVALEHHEGKISSIALERELRNLSRVGFNKTKSKAVFCLESRYSASIVTSSKGPSGVWKTDEARMLWAR